PSGEGSGIPRWIASPSPFTEEYLNMKQRSRTVDRNDVTKLTAAIILLGTSLMGCDPQTSATLKPDPAGRPLGGGNYVQTNLVSDTGIPNTTTDANLVNPWGLAFGPTTPAWVA